MLGFIISIAAEVSDGQKGNFSGLRNQVKALDYGGRHSKQLEFQAENVFVISLTYSNKSCFYEDANWLVFVYGHSFLYQSLDDEIQNILLLLNTNNLENLSQKLSGSFVYFLKDKQKQKCYLITDPIGSIQVYRVQIGSEVLFSTEWKAFIGYLITGHFKG